jgi:hypothetical protein
VIERIVAPLGTQRARFPGGDRALATTSGRHHGQAIRIDSFEVDDLPILGPPPGSVKGPRRILATSWSVSAWGTLSEDQEARGFSRIVAL